MSAISKNLMICASQNINSPTTGLEEKITGVANAANVDLKTLSQNLSEYLIESSKYKFYNLVEKYMPEGVKNPHIQNAKLL